MNYFRMKWKNNLLYIVWLAIKIYIVLCFVRLADDDYDYYGNLFSILQQNWMCTEKKLIVKNVCDVIFIEKLN